MEGKYMQLNRLLSYISSTFLTSGILFSHTLAAEVWVDEDGYQIAVIEDSNVSIYDPTGYFYFDEMFRSAVAGRPLRLCFGYAGGHGVPSDCLEGLSFKPRTSDKGRIRGLSIDLGRYPFTVSSITRALESGSYVKLSVDDYALYTAVTLHKSYRLKEERYD